MLKLGQAVRVINIAPLSDSGIVPPLSLGEERKIEAFTSCGCGEIHLDLGLKSKYNYIKCYKCGDELQLGYKIHWAHSSRVEPIE